MGPPDDPNRHPSDTDTRPFFSIPYWTTPLSAGGRWDTGEDRPLPAQVVSYACESIKTSAYQPGAALDVTVDIRNVGGGNSASIATVVVYWDVPSVGFAHPTFFAATTVSVQPSRNFAASQRTPTMTAVIPATAPDHICLVVCVSHPQDKAGTACDPFHDRHWAQRNLQAVTAAVGAPVIFPVMVTNPSEVASVFDVQVGSADERRASTVAHMFDTEPSGIQGRVRLLDEQGAEVSVDGEQTRMSVELGPLGQRQLQVMIELDTDVPRGRSALIEVGLIDRRGAQGLVGSLGVVLLPPTGDS